MEPIEEETDEKTRMEEVIEEEKKKKLDYNPQQRAAYLRGAVDSIIEMKRKHVAKHDIQMAHFDFAEKYPTLFAKLFEPGVDMRQIDYMINMVGTIGKNGRTYYDTSQVVGQQLADRYIMRGAAGSKKNGK